MRQEWYKILNDVAITTIIRNTFRDNTEWFAAISAVKYNIEFTFNFMWTVEC